MNIYQKILNIMSRVEYLAKDDSVEFKQTKYKAMSEEKVTRILRKEMISEGLVVYQKELTSSRSENISHVDVIYRIVNAENPDEYIDVASCGDGYDSQDKGAGKAMTYAFKYMWLRTFAIPTGEDPDKISSEEIDEIEAERKRKALEASKISETKVNAIISKANADGVDINLLLKLYNVSAPSELTEKQYAQICNTWTREVIPKCKA